MIVVSQMTECCWDEKPVSVSGFLCLMWLCVKVAPLHLLTQDMEKEISSALGHGPQDEILSSAFKLRLTRGQIQTLKNYHWLKDEVTCLFSFFDYHLYFPLYNQSASYLVIRGFW